MADSEHARVIEQQKQQCPFCKIIKGEIESKKIFENDLTISLLDIHPAEDGHVLVMAKEHYPIMPLIPPDIFKDIFSVATRIADIEKVVYLKQGTTIFIANGAAAGQQSSHFMVHVIPRDDFNQKQFDLNPRKADQDKIKELAQTLTHNLSIMLKKEYNNFPLLDDEGNSLPLKQRYSKEHVINIIKQNIQLKEALIKEPVEFKKAIPKNDQLRQMFEDINPNDVIRHFVPNFDDTEKFQEGPVIKAEIRDEIDNVHEDESNEDGNEDDSGEEDNEEEKVNINQENKIIQENNNYEYMNEEELIKLIESKPKLKDVILNDFDNFVQQLPNSDKLSKLFAGHNPEDIKNKLGKGGLDLVSRLFE